MRGRLPIVSAQLEDATGSLTATWFGRRGFAGRLNAGDRVFVHGRVALKRRRNAAVSVEMNVLHHRMLADGEAYRGSDRPGLSREQGGAVARDRRPDREERGAAAERSSATSSRARSSAGTASGRCRRRGARCISRSRSTARCAHASGCCSSGSSRSRSPRRSSAPGATPQEGRPRWSRRPACSRQFEAQLPFRLTGAQRATIATIYADMARSAPMNRLLQGDVGSGKTLVAAAAIVLAQRGGVQSALDGADRTARGAARAQARAAAAAVRRARRRRLGEPDGARPRADVQGRLASGECDLAVGTHALLTETVDVSPARARDRRRAAPVRRHAARAATLEEPRPAHPVHDGDADSAHARAVALRRSRPVGPRRAAAGPHADRDLLSARRVANGSAYEFVRRNVDWGRQAYIVAPAIGGDDDRVRGRADQRGRRIRGAARRSARRHPRRVAARAPAGAREGRDHGTLRAARDRRPDGDDRRRGRRRRRRTRP